jgi:hypothetical protein
VDDAKRTRLIQLLGMMGSAHDGEVLNAARMAQKLIGSEALTWEEVFAPQSNGRDYTHDTTQYQAGYAAGYAKGCKDGFASAVPQTYRARGLTWRGFALDLRNDHFDDLSEWEQGFVESFIERGWNNPTPKQRAIFERIADTLGVDCPGA